MKYSLIIKVCSAILASCSPEVKYNLLFNSWLECANAGYLQAVSINNNLGSQFVNDNQVVVQFSCTALEEL